MKKNNNESCPKCGTKPKATKGGFTAIVAVVSKEINVDNTHTAKNEHSSPVQLPKTAQERIEALRNAGVDVSNLFAMNGANGGEYVASNENGKLVILDDNDPIFNQIIAQGTIPNRQLFRRWVMAQMFHMMTCTSYSSKNPIGVTNMIHRLGYEYQWKMLMDELYAQMKMEKRDPINFADRNRWFNTPLVVVMAKDYIAQLKKHTNELKTRKCKGIPYKRIKGRNIFESDLQVKLYSPFEIAISRIAYAQNAAQLYNATKTFNNMRIKLAFETPQSKVWVNAYKGSGAFFTMQNLIRFHGCVVVDDAGKRLDKFQSLAFISTKAELYSNDGGWRLLAVLKKMLSDNNIDIKKKIASWRKGK